VPGARVYAYYNPHNEGTTQGTQMIVQEGR